MSCVSKFLKYVADNCDTNRYSFKEMSNHIAFAITLCRNTYEREKQEIRISVMCGYLLNSFSETQIALSKTSNKLLKFKNQVMRLIVA